MLVELSVMGWLCADCEELPPVVTAHAGVAQASTLGEPQELFVGVEMAAARERLRRGWCPSEPQSRRVDRDRPSGAQHTLALARHSDRVIEEE